jgi:hypothetical protein
MLNGMVKSVFIVAVISKGTGGDTKWGVGLTLN